MEIDETRLARARLLETEHLGETRYRVGEDNYVDLEGDPPCACADWYYHKVPFCKHLLAVLLHRGIIL